MEKGWRALRVCMLSFRISVDVLPLSQPSGVKTGPDQLGKDGQVKAVSG